MLVPLLTAFGVSLGINSLLAAGAVKPLRILAQVNRRSAHKIPVPVGGGIGILCGMALSLPFIWQQAQQYISGHLLIICLCLGILSWWDDRLELKTSFRFGSQMIAAAICLSLLPYLTWWLLPFLFFALLWFTNLYNFMDGSDGMMAIETISISLGLALLTHSLLPLCLAAATLGFLCFNWPPARLFAGDVGSIPIGFFLGFLLIQFALEQTIIPAVILPLYFIMDASIVLIKRILKQEAFMQAHSEHYYQQAIKKGFSHKRVMLTVLLLNLFLILCAYASFQYPILATAFAALAVMLCLWHFRKPA